MIEQYGSILPMLQQFPGDEMQTWPVGKKVGNSRNQGPALIEPIEAGEPLRLA